MVARNCPRGEETSDHCSLPPDLRATIRAVVPLQQELTAAGLDVGVDGRGYEQA